MDLTIHEAFARHWRYVPRADRGGRTRTKEILETEHCSCSILNTIPSLTPEL